MEWEEFEDKLIVDLYGKKTSKEIALLLNHKRGHNVRQRARVLGIVRPPSRKWNLEEDQVLYDLYPFFPAREIGEILDRELNGIRWRAEKLKIKKEMYWKPEEDTILLNKYFHKTINELTQDFPSRSWEAIRLRAERLLKRKGLDLKNPWNDVNHEYFKEPNLQNCYWAGFIAADGCVFNNQIKIELNSKDHSLLEEFRKVIEFTGKIHRFKKINQSGTISKMCRIVISSVSWKNDLAKHFHILPNKTFILIPPDITEELLLKSFIIGYIDGDGGIYHRDYPVLQVTGNYNIVSFIKEKLDSWYPTYYGRKLPKVRKTHSRAFSHSIGGRRARDIILDLKQIDVPKLERKWGKIR
jgi:hypothetical protein